MNYLEFLRVTIAWFIELQVLPNYVNNFEINHNQVEQFMSTNDAELTSQGQDGSEREKARKLLHSISFSLYLVAERERNNYVI